MKKVCTRGYPTFWLETEKVWFATQTYLPCLNRKSQSDWVMSQKMKLSLTSVDCPQTRRIQWAGDRPAVFRPGFQSWKRLFIVFFNYAGPLVVDALPKKAAMTRQLSDISDQTSEQNHKNIVSPWECCSSKSKGHHLISGGRTAKSPALPTLCPDLALCDCMMAVFYIENWPCGKDAFANSRPCRFHNFMPNPLWSNNN